MSDNKKGQNCEVFFVNCLTAGKNLILTATPVKKFVPVFKSNIQAFQVHCTLQLKSYSHLSSMNAMKTRFWLLGGVTDKKTITMFKRDRDFLKALD